MQDPSGHWAELDRLRDRHVVSLLCFPLPPIAGAVFDRLFGLGLLAFYVLMVPIFGWIVWTARQLVQWPCPRCGNLFAKDTPGVNQWLFVGACRHCGLARNAVTWPP